MYIFEHMTLVRLIAERNKFINLIVVIITKLLDMERLLQPLRLNRSFCNHYSPRLVIWAAHCFKFTHCFIRLLFWVSGYVHFHSAYYRERCSGTECLLLFSHYSVAHRHSRDKEQVAVVYCVEVKLGQDLSITLPRNQQTWSLRGLACTLGWKVTYRVLHLNSL